MESSGYCWNCLLDSELGACLRLPSKHLPSTRGRHAEHSQSHIRCHDRDRTCCGHFRPYLRPQISFQLSDANRILCAECRMGYIFVGSVGSILVLVFAQQMTARHRSNHALERTATRFTLTFCVAKTLSLRGTRAPGGRRSALSR